MNELKSAFRPAILTAAITVLLAFVVAGVIQRGPNDLVEQVRDNTDRTTRYLSAVACVLTLPIDPETGRDPGLARACFTDSGVAPPSFLLRP